MAKENRAKRAWIILLATLIPASRGFPLRECGNSHGRKQVLAPDRKPIRSMKRRDPREAHRYCRSWNLSVMNSDSDEYSYDEEESSSSCAGANRRRYRPIRLSNHNAKSAELNRQEAQRRHEQALKDPTLLTNVKFQERQDIHPATKRALAEVMGLQSMTEIQSKTYAEGRPKVVNENSS